MKSTQMLVIMPLYNTRRFAAEAIESILGQTYSDFRFLIINDGSTDGSEEIARSFRDNRIQVVDQINQGPGAVMNRATAYASDAQIPYIARMDADDLSLPDRIQEQISLLEKNSEAAACSSNCYYINEDTGEIVGTSTVSNAAWLIRREITHGLRGMIQGACMFRTKALLEVGGIVRNFKQAEETDLFLRLNERYQMINSLAFLYKIRIRTGSISLGDIHGNVMNQFYALDCYEKRRKGQPEREFWQFKESPGVKMKYRIWREENMLKMWRSGLGNPGLGPRVIAALIDPRRVLVRIIRKLYTLRSS